MLKRNLPRRKIVRESLQLRRMRLVARRTVLLPQDDSTVVALVQVHFRHPQDAIDEPRHRAGDRSHSRRRALRNVPIRKSPGGISCRAGREHEAVRQDLSAIRSHGNQLPVLERHARELTGIAYRRTQSRSCIEKCAGGRNRVGRAVESGEDDLRQPCEVDIRFKLRQIGTLNNPSHLAPRGLLGNPGGDLLLVRRVRIAFQ